MCCIFNFSQYKHLQVGIRGQPFIIDGETFADLKIEESAWTLVDQKYVNVNLEKVYLYKAYFIDLVFWRAMSTAALNLLELL